MNSLSLFPWTIAVVAALVAAITDVRRFRIPNWLTAPLLVQGLLYHAAVAGAEGLASSGSGMLVGFMMLFPLYLAGGMGAGDVKLMAGLGAWLKPVATLEVLVLSCLFAGGYSLILLLLRRAGSDAVKGQRIEEVAARPDRRSRLIPFGVTTAVGLVVASAWGYWLT